MNRGGRFKELRKAIDRLAGASQEKSEATSRVQEMRERKSVLQKKAHALRAGLVLLQEELSLLDEAIEKEVRGMDRQRRRTGPPGKGSGGETLSELALLLLKLNRRPLTLTELARQILDWGYETRSGFVDFRTNVAHALRRLGTSVSRVGKAWIFARGSKSPKHEPASV